MSECVNNAKATNERESLSYNKSEFARLTFDDNGKELRMNGKLYDVVSIKAEGGQTIVTIEFDAKETALVGAFADLLNQQQDKASNSSPLKTIVSHYQQDYINNTGALVCFYQAFSKTYQISKQTYPSTSFVADNLTPPPQFFLV